MSSNNDMPQSVKIVMSMIDRVGFPIVAFLLMSAIAYKFNESINENTKVLVEMRASMVDFKQQVMNDHSQMLRDLHDTRSK